MSVIKNIKNCIGDWKGTNRLHLPGKPMHESRSRLKVVSAVQNTFVNLSYDWSVDGKTQEGFMMLSYEGEQAEAAWSDSWHMRDKIMHCHGQVDEDGSTVLRGSYKVEGHPDWGWRMDLVPTASEFKILMYNVTPDGDEMLGVEATYSRI